VPLRRPVTIEDLLLHTSGIILLSRSMAAAGVGTFRPPGPR